MATILNIGLNIGDRRNAVDIARAVQLIGELNGKATGAAKVHQHGDELTLVVGTGVTDMPKSAIYALAEALSQEAIAFFDPETGYRGLEGPAAKAWGEFDAQLFVMPSGRKLSDTRFWNPSA